METSVFQLSRTKSPGWPTRTFLVSRLILLMLWIASPLSAGVLLWNTITSTPISLALDYASAINNFGIVVGSTGTFGDQQAAEVATSASAAVIYLSGVPVNSAAT